MSTTGTDYKSLVLAAVNIVELISQSVALKRAGKDFKGLCPFHQEKTPSFSVSPTRQSFYCYGCKEGGNAIDFVMKRDRIEFKEALRALGEQHGIEMPKYGVSREKAGERQVLLDAQSASCSFFEKSLAHPQLGQAGRAYLESRQISSESIQRFQIGLALDAWDSLLRGPVGKRFSPQQLAMAGLAKARERGDGHYDTFRNRLMFPIRDDNGRVIAFGGRVMPGSQDPAKYLNSPETPLFSKGKSVFGLDLARHRIVESRTAIVVEGYTDVIVAHQFGVSNVVSVLGTAMTEQHVTTLRRFADRIVLLFDADTAGDLAVDRAVGLFLTQPVDIAIASMPENIDPDEYVIEHGAEGFERMIAAATDALSYKWKQLSRRFNEGGNSLTGQQKAIEEYLGLLSDARGQGPIDALRWGQALARVSRLTEISREDLNRRFRMPKGQPRGQMTRAPISAAPKNFSAQDRAERWILGILLLEPRRWTDVQSRVQVDEFTDPVARKLAEIYWQHQRDEGEPVLRDFLGVLRESVRAENSAPIEGTAAVSVDQLIALTLETVDEVEAFGDVEKTLDEALAHLEYVRRMRADQKQTAELRRKSEEHPGEQAEIDLLKRMQEQARRPDLRRAL